ncbi:hypothetical protein AVEN_53497-1 [Araneus ventricosus]|uniref:Uncharacterized protein n=1 Tax=Araneus ventricosus TaxID=182803 RepID=A0A4Y2AAE3_ARAVE|nr:hypothetical protein AVEN_53497-1 [Araneus ventricosus]
MYFTPLIASPTFCVINGLFDTNRMCAPSLVAPLLNPLRTGAAYRVSQWQGHCPKERGKNSRWGAASEQQPASTTSARDKPFSHSRTQENSSAGLGANLHAAPPADVSFVPEDFTLSCCLSHFIEFLPREIVCLMHQMARKADQFY